MMKKLTFLLSLFLVITTALVAQIPFRQGMGGQNMNMGHFYGKLVDSTSKPIEAATIQLVQNKIDTVTKKKRDFILATVLSEKNGDFSIEGLPLMGNFVLRISAVGYKKLDKKVAFEINMNAAKSGDYASLMNGVDKDLGNIRLEVSPGDLENLTVTSSKPLLQLNFDRKVYNVEKDLSAAGGTAVDIMKNVPSVNVDIDGNVTLRNSPPQIFIDNRPTTLSLDQIPADQIASVEIITNPSAKYDASGGGAGILNIVLKKNRKAGYNGNVRASIDSRGRPGGGGDVNIKQGKLNFFSAAMIGMPKSISTSHTERVDFLQGKSAYLTQESNPRFQGIFGFGRLGIDYFMDNRNTFTVSGNYVRRKFNTSDRIEVLKDTLSGSTHTYETGIRNSASESKGYNYGGSMGFKHNYAKSGKEWTADMNYHFMNNESIADYNSQFFDADNLPKGYHVFEQSITAGDTKFITVQTDYVDPLSKTMKLEMGARMSKRFFNSANDNYIRLPSGIYFPIPGLGVKYKFNDEVYAGYATFSQQLKKFSYQAGLRLESSEYQGNFISKNQQFSNHYPISLFPSAYLTYKLTDKQDMQLNYSRKINRPNFFQLIPFIDYSDSLNLSTGNPNLIPEFTNLVELGYSNQYKAGSSVLISLYGRLSNDLITRYQYRTANPNPAKTDSVLITSYANANSSSTIGLELTGKNKLTRWWDITANFNLFSTSIKAGNLPGTEDNSRFSWFGKLSNSFKLPNKFSIQLNSDYQAKTILPASSSRGGGGGGFFMGGGFGQSPSNAQGYIKPVYGADISIRRDFMKNNAASLTLQFNDIFCTKVSASHAESSFFIQDNFRRRDPQVLRLNFNWRFGKFDVALIKRKNIKGEMESMQGLQSATAQ